MKNGTCVAACPRPSCPPASFGSSVPTSASPPSPPIPTPTLQPYSAPQASAALPPTPSLSGVPSLPQYTSPDAYQPETSSAVPAAVPPIYGPLFDNKDPPLAVNQSPGGLGTAPAPSVPNPSGTFFGLQPSSPAQAPRGLAAPLSAGDGFVPVSLGPGTYVEAPLGSYGTQGAYGSPVVSAGYGSGASSPKSTTVGQLRSLSLPGSTVPASEYVLQYSPYGECSAVCGEGTQERVPVCLSLTYLNPVDLSLCSDKMASLEPLSRPCKASG